MLSVSLFLYFSSDKLAKHTKKCVVLFSSFNLFLISKKGVGVYKAFNFNDLTLLFYGAILLRHS